jgi:hypothetical protein
MVSKKSLRCDYDFYRFIIGHTKSLLMMPLLFYVAVDTCPGPRVGGTFFLLCLPFGTTIPKFNTSRNRVVTQSFQSPVRGRPAQRQQRVVIFSCRPAKKGGPWRRPTVCSRDSLYIQQIHKLTTGLSTENPQSFNVMGPRRRRPCRITHPRNRAGPYTQNRRRRRRGLWSGLSGGSPPPITSHALGPSQGIISYTCRRENQTTHAC